MRGPRGGGGKVQAARVRYASLVRQSGLALDDLDGPVIVAMLAMLMMQPAIDEIIHMVPMRHRLVSAAWAMDMPGFVPFMAVLRRAAVRVLGGHVNDMLLDLVAFLVVQMSIMQIIDMIAVLHPEVTAIRAMMMRMLRMRAGGHETFSFRSIEAWVNEPLHASVGELPANYT
jgi:hypothetical protein